MSLWNPISWFKSKKEKQDYPRRIRVVLNDIAKSKGISDEANLLIQIVEGKNNIVEEMPYTTQLLRATEEKENLPVEYEDFEPSEDFEFSPFEELGTIKEEKNE